MTGAQTVGNLDIICFNVSNAFDILGTKQKAYSSLINEKNKKLVMLTRV